MVKHNIVIAKAKTYQLWFNHFCLCEWKILPPPIQLGLSVFHAATMESMVSRIGPTSSTSNTMKSTVAAPGNEEIQNTHKVNGIPELDTVSWTPHVKSVNSPFNVLTVT